MAAFHPKITQLEGSVTLKQKGDGWKPDKGCQSTIESCGYIIGETIGEGEASKVKKAICKKLNLVVAVKIIQKRHLPKDALQHFVPREISLLQRLQHPALPDLYEVYETSNCIYMVMEYVPNGSLLDFVNKMGCLGEADARRLFHQLLDVVSFLHDNNVCHRDIKCDNILLDDHYNLKLIDFGFARYMPSKGMLSTTCGSYVYTAPEVLEGEQYDGVQADIWSLGVCLYSMLCGKLPYRDDDTDILRYSMREKLKFFKYVSRDCRDLVRRMLSIDPRYRPPISSIKKWDWMCKPIKQTGDSASVSAMSVASVINDHQLPADFDPNIEHGFTCEQTTERLKTSRVSDVLKSVAENHSTGQSSINLQEIPIIAKKASSTAMLTGVSGPVGRKISQQLGLDTGTGVQTDTKSAKWGSALGDTKGAVGGKPKGKPAFGKAFNALKKFRVAAKTVRATRKFRRGPLNTILQISQEEAMEKMIEQRSGQREHDKKDLHYTQSGKVALVCAKHKEEELEAKRKKEAPVIDYVMLEKKEKKRELKDTFNHILPVSDISGRCVAKYM